MTATPTAGPTAQAPAERDLAPARAPLRPFALTVLAIVVAFGLVVGLGIAGAAIDRSRRTTTATVTVTGTGTVQGTPNEIQFTIGVQTVAGTATGALNENNARMRTLVAALLKAGALKKDLETSGLDIYENTNQYGELTGFTVQDTLGVTMFDLSKAGAAIEAGAKAARNGIVFNGITLSISDDSKYLAAARTRAMHSALLAARSDASGGSDTVGSIIRITDQETSSVEPIGLPYALSADRAGVPLEAGQQPVTVDVTVVYALNG